MLYDITISLFSLQILQKLCSNTRSNFHLYIPDIIEQEIWFYVEYLWSDER